MPRSRSVPRSRQTARRLTRGDARTPNVNRATSAEAGNQCLRGLANDLSLVTLAPSPTGMTFTCEQYYDAEDVATMRPSFDEGLADIATRLVARFGGRVSERFSESRP